MEKNINIEISKLTEAIYGCCNESGLPISVISLIISDIHNNIKNEEYNYLQSVMNGNKEEELEETDN